MVRSRILRCKEERWLAPRHRLHPPEQIRQVPDPHIPINARNAVRYRSRLHSIRETRRDPGIPSGTHGWGQLQTHKVSASFRQIPISPRANGPFLLEGRVLPSIRQNRRGPAGCQEARWRYSRPGPRFKNTARSYRQIAQEMQIPQLYLVLEEVGDLSVSRVRRPSREPQRGSPKHSILAGNKGTPSPDNSHWTAQLPWDGQSVVNVSSGDREAHRCPPGLTEEKHSVRVDGRSSGSIQHAQIGSANSLGLHHHFIPSWSTRLITDASRPHGLGFVLMQHREDKTAAIQCGSQSLSPAEKNYSMLELELTAIVWTIQKCNFFLKGIEKFEVVTDHRPLVGIFAKSMPQIDNARITRLREKILDRPFDVKWLAGKDNVIADALSRAPAPTTDGATSLPVSSCVVAPNTTLTRIIECCQTNPAYKQIVGAFQQGRSLTDLPEDNPARRLKHVWGRISLSDDGVLIVDGVKLCMPPGAPREDTLRQLHECHCGYEENFTNSQVPLLLALNEIWHQSNDRQVRGLLTAATQQAHWTFHHDVRQLPHGTDFCRFLSHQRQNLYSYGRQVQRIHLGRDATRSGYQGCHQHPRQDHKGIRHSPHMQDRWGATIPRAFRQILQAKRDHSWDLITLQSKV